MSRYRLPALLALLVLFGAACNPSSGQSPETTKPRNHNYAALGDSFASGHGAGAYEDDGCKRSQVAYPRLLDKLPTVDLVMTSFLACTGATTQSLIDTQVPSLPADTGVVTLTIGGNNMGFGKFVAQCVLQDCSVNNKQFFDAAGAAQQPLIDAYRAVQEKAPHAKVYVANYPYIVDTQVCQDLANVGITQAEVDTAHRLTDRLNEVITEAIRATNHLMGSNTLALVDVTGSGSPFSDHELCSGALPFFNALDTSDINGSFHPNAAGQVAYSTAIVDRMNAA